jgi:hypothetical protein
MRLGECGVVAWWGSIFGGPAATGIMGHVWACFSGSAPKAAHRFSLRGLRLAVGRCARTNALSAAQTGRGTESEASSNVPINRSITSDSVTRTSIDRVHYSCCRSRDHRACAKKHRAFQRNLDA